MIGCAVHVCNPSCLQCHSKGSSLICRHNFYHVVNLCGEEPDQAVRIRRRGKALRGCVAIFRETTYGMAGRILTMQKHFGECCTNYAGMITIRCNLDVQDLRRVLRPDLLDGAVRTGAPCRPLSEAAPDYAHGACPQRFPAIRMGKQEDWGWMGHLATTEHSRHAVVRGRRSCRRRSL